jgi:hypothetical protein
MIHVESPHAEIEKDVSKMLSLLSKKGLNRVLWWNQQG